MRALSAAVLAASGFLVLVLVAQAQTSNGAAVSTEPDPGYRAPRTPWGDPDLQGKWPSTDMASVPLQRPEAFGTRNVLTDAEFAERTAQAARQVAQDHEDFDFENPSVPFGRVGGGQSPPQHWFERPTPQRQASLVVEPVNGRLPARKPDAGGRAVSGGPADLEASFSLYDRCITRGLTGSILPGGYSNGNEIVQAPGYVTIVNEMIHESRVVPLDGRPRLNGAIRHYMGDSRGRWDGETLVVETTNFLDRRGVGMSGAGASDALTITERFRRTSDTTMSYSFTVDDPEWWTAPFTVQMILRRDDRYGMFEYACHEGNYALPNILSGARAAER